jgi:hypothetical protein
LGTSARSVIWLELASTDRSLNSSLPRSGQTLPSSSTTVTATDPALPALRKAPLAIALRRRITSPWVA